MIKGEENRIHASRAAAVSKASGFRPAADTNKAKREMMRKLAGINSLRQHVQQRGATSEGHEEALSVTAKAVKMEQTTSSAHRNLNNLIKTSILKEFSITAATLCGVQKLNMDELGGGTLEQCESPANTRKLGSPSDRNRLTYSNMFSKVDLDNCAAEGEAEDATPIDGESP